MASLSVEQLNDLCEHMRGTCEDIDSHLQEMYEVELTDLDEATLEEIDDRIFRCEACSWWCEISEMDNADEEATEHICKDCASAV